MKTLSLPPITNKPAHLYTLDVIRGLSALVVVLAHWEFFYYANDVYVHDGYDKTALPWYSGLSLVYDHSMVIVDFFFLLSGFVFYWLYADRVSGGKVDFGRFMGLRLSRLYPVHFVGLLAVAILQVIMLYSYGHYYIIQYNDVYHFFLNIFFIQNWGFEKGPSFNGPSWSASVEVFLYILFFIACRLNLQRKIGLLALMLPAGLLMYCFYDLLGKGIFSFFEGALVYYGYMWIVRENKVKQYLSGVTIVTGLLWAVLLSAYKFPALQAIVIRLLQKVVPGHDPAVYLHASVITGRVFFRSIIAPLTVLALVLWEKGRNLPGKKIAWFGNCGYAMYLLHFPLQIVFVLVVDHYGFSRRIFYSPYIMVLYFAILLPMSLLAHYYFEYPIREKIRNRFFRKDKQSISLHAKEVIIEPIS